MAERKCGKYLFYQKEIEMYNDRTRPLEVSGERGTPMTPRSRVNQAANNLHSDIPSSELLNRDESRRSCTGELRSSASQGMRADRTDGHGMPCTCASGWGLTNHPLAMVYSPCQIWASVYAPDAALERGTMFAELDLPFEATANKRGCNI